jgi:N-acetylglucosaminyldiphosphoundecaprenol N-acetyl-beta-D-mannosaminyltransferase
MREGARVLGAFVDAISWESALRTVDSWGAARQSRYVCACNVHVVMSARRNDAMKETVENADMCVPDGMPVAWMLRRLGFPLQLRVSGPDLMWKYCGLAAASGTSVYFYGSTPETLDLLQRRLVAAFPSLRIAGAYSPPFREQTGEEDASTVERINSSGAGVVFVGLGCPKQELWMAGHRGRVRAVMIGVGAAFDFHAGTVKRAPGWMQEKGLEWAYRLAAEPQRLCRRYLTTNIPFMLGALSQLLRSR